MAGALADMPFRQKLGERRFVMGRHFSAGAVAAAALFCAMAFTPEAGALDVNYDLGGSVELRRREIDLLRGSSERVRIEGLCVSACTLYLALPQTCVSASARLGFHGPASPFPGRKLPKGEFERVSRLMADHYPKLLRKWFLQTGRHLQGDYHLLSGRQVIALGARAC